MLTPEIIARVDAWLAARESWLLQSDDRWLLLGEWRCLADRRAAAKPHERTGIEAAMRGVLLALVREAWGDPNIVIDWDGNGWQALAGNLGWIEQAGCGWGTEAEALAAALEAAP